MAAAAMSCSLMPTGIRSTKVMPDFVNAGSKWQVFYGHSQMYLLNTAMHHTSHLSKEPAEWQCHQPDWASSLSILWRAWHGASEVGQAAHVPSFPMAVTWEQLTFPWTPEPSFKG